MTQEPTRITTSTRDLADVRARLQTWLAGRLPAAAGPEVTDLQVPAANGMSSETVLFDATWTEDGARAVHRLVARVAPDPANLPVFPSYELEHQFRLMAAVEELGAAPVPHVYWYEPDPAAIGSPFFVMARVEGQVPPDVMPYPLGSWVTEASPAERERMQDGAVRVLAALHGIDSPERRFDFLTLPGTGSPLARHFAGQRDYLAWVTEGLRSPLLEACFDWLVAHWPAEEGPTVLNWGDARIGNMMFRDFTPVAVLDWEMAALAPRELDLGWFVFLHRFFEDIAARYGLTGLPDFLRRDDVAVTYAGLTGHTPRELDWYCMYAATRHGVVMMRTQRRAIHFGERDMPDDPDDLVLHRPTLEAILDGRYEYP